MDKVELQQIIKLLDLIDPQPKTLAYIEDWYENWYFYQTFKKHEPLEIFKILYK
jgi:hypothetical protein